MLLLSKFFTFGSENILCIMSILLNIVRLVSWDNIWSVLDNVSYAFENMYSAVVWSGDVDRSLLSLMVYSVSVVVNGGLVYTDFYRDISVNGM